MNIFLCLFFVLYLITKNHLGYLKRFNLLNKQYVNIIKFLWNFYATFRKYHELKKIFSCIVNYVVWSYLNTKPLQNRFKCSELNIKSPNRMSIWLNRLISYWHSLQQHIHLNRCSLVSTKTNIYKAINSITFEFCK